MHRNYNGPDDYLGTHAHNDYVPSRLEIQRHPEGFIEFGLWMVGTFIKHLFIR
ncbi:hypothetical protein [Salinicoccus roseus]|uniref:hypothetical protein n=1 Tax=Salinicoccus roseus TaxID=45670 RepID=UPI003D9FB3C4